MVTVVDLVRDATDGWTWCLAACRVALGVEDGDALPFAEALGELTASMHLALADTPTGPVADHGDYHVGQVLRTPDGELFVIDFDGNPTLPPEERVRHRPAAYDVAGMLVALENVGHVVQHYAPDLPDDDVVAWTEQVQGEFLAAYRSSADAFARPRAAGRVRARPDPPGARVRRLPPAAVALRARGGAAPEGAVVRPDLFLADLLEKPARLRELDLHDAWSFVAPPARVLLVGMGSSHYANLVCAARLRAAGVHAVAELASSDLLPVVTPDTLVIAVSASAGSVETLDAVDRLAVPVVALANQPGPLTERA